MTRLVVYVANGKYNIHIMYIYKALFGLYYINKLEVLVNTHQSAHVVLVQLYLCGLHVLHNLCGDYCPGNNPNVSVEGK